MVKINYFLLIGLLLAGQLSISQNLSGIWEGKTGPSSFYTKPVKVVLELTMINDSTLTGFCHAYYTRGRFEHHKLSGHFNKSRKIVFLSEDSLLDFKKGIFDKIDNGTYTLWLFNISSGLKLDGEWTANKKRWLADPMVKKWFFKEKKEDVPKADLQINTEAKAIVIDSINKTKRIDDLQMIIEVDKKDKDSIRIDLYDNGQIDNDTVSVYVNERLVINKQMITAKPVTFFISLSEDQHFDKIKLIAENLGTIPPNTALMVVTTKKKKYDVLLSSTYEKSAVVEFFLKEK